MANLPLESGGGLIERLKFDFPSLKFRAGRKFAFRPPRTVVIPNDFSECDGLILLHEIGHALTGRYWFDTEVERLKIEVLAWEKAKELAPLYGIEIDEELIETELDTYRDYLHQKSRCPSCGLTRFQTPDSLWHCPRCNM